jgi:hypothetical protein
MKSRSFFPRLLTLAALLPLLVSSPAPNSALASPLPDDPWNASQTITPADFAKELHDKHDPSLKIIYVGVSALYAGAHIPGSLFHGPGSKEEGITDLKKFASALPKDSNIVIYCGCCPLDRCPNLRPAYAALHEMGFTRIRVLILPTSFAADWIEKGYPIEKSPNP